MPARYLGAFAVVKRKIPKGVDGIVTMRFKLPKVILLRIGFSRHISLVQLTIIELAAPEKPCKEYPTNSADRGTSYIVRIINPTNQATETNK